MRRPILTHQRVAPAHKTCNPSGQETVLKIYQLVQNLKKTVSTMAARVCYITFLIAFFISPYPAFSQQANYPYLNPKPRTFSVRNTTPSLESKLFFKENLTKEAPSTTNSGVNNLFFNNCGGGAQGGESTTAEGNVTPSPDSKVYNAGNAVDGNLSTYSELRIGVQQKGVAVTQRITFTGTTYTTDIVKLTLSLDTVLKEYDIFAQAYSGNNPVGTVQELSDILPLRPSTVDVTFSPGVIFDEVRISVIALQNGNHRARINLHEIYITPPAPQPSGETSNPTPTSSNVTACEGSIVLTVDNPTAGFVYRWYDASNVLVQESTSTTYSPSLTASGSPYVYYLTSARSTGCTIESAKHQINLTVKPKPTTPAIISYN
jgi:hypothetical protein